jgi:hypothetical protein
MLASSTWPYCRCARLRCRPSRRRRVSWVCSRAAVSSVPPAGGLTHGIHQRQQHSFAVQAQQPAAAFVQRGRVPEGRHGARDVARGPPQQPALPEDQHPGGDRHGQQQQGHAATHVVALCPELGQAVHGSAQNVAHAVQARPAAGHEACSAQAAFGVVGAAAALVRDLDAFARAGKEHRVFADDVAAAHGGKADAAAHAFAGVAVAREHALCGQVDAARARHGFAHGQRGAAGCVDLVLVVGLDHFHVVTLAQRAGGLFQQAQHHVHAHAHVGCKDHTHALRQAGDLSLLRRREAGGADHGAHAQFGAQGQVGQGAFGAGEIDQHIGLRPGRHACRLRRSRPCRGRQRRPRPGPAQGCRHSPAPLPAGHRARPARPQPACGPCGRRLRRWRP